MEQRRRVRRLPRRFDDFVLELEHSLAEVNAEISALSQQIQERCANSCNFPVTQAEVTSASSAAGGIIHEVSPNPMSGEPVRECRNVGGQFATFTPRQNSDQYDPHVLTPGYNRAVNQSFNFRHSTPRYNPPMDGSGARQIMDNNQNLCPPPSRTVTPADIRQSKLLYLSTISPVKFDGNSKDFPAFYDRMRNLDDGILLDYELLEFLPKFLSGEALRVFGNMRGLTFSSVMDRFIHRYGHPTTVANSYINELTQGKSIGAEDRRGLIDLADKLAAAVCSLNREHFWEASCSPNMKKIVDRLPVYMRNDWERKVVDVCEAAHKNAPDLDDLAKFVTRHAQAKNNPYYQSNVRENVINKDQQRNATRAAARGGPPRSDTHRPFLSAATEVQSNIYCGICDRRGHTVAVCKRFLDCPTSDRYGPAKLKRLCYLCLEQGCRAGRCSRADDSQVCRTCPRAHHRLLPCNTQPRVTHPDRRPNKQNTVNTVRQNSGNATPNALPNECTPSPIPNSSVETPPPSGSRADQPEVLPSRVTICNSIVERSDVGTSDTVLPSRPTAVKTDFLLETLPIKVHGPSGTITTLAMLDSGSKASFISEDLVSKLGITGVKVTRDVSTVRDTLRQEMLKVCFRISNISTEREVDVDQDAYALKGIDLSRQLSQGLPNVDLSQFPHLKDLSFEVEHPVISLLIGLPVMEAHRVISYRRGGDDEPYAVETPLGFAVAGPIRSRQMCGPVVSWRTDVSAPQSRIASLEELIRRFLQIEEFGPQYIESMGLSDCEQQAVRQFNESVMQRPDGHYQCRLLWKTSDCSLPYNRSRADSRLKSLSRKFAENPSYEKMYRDAMNENVSNGYASPIPPEEVNVIGPRTFYLSHFGVTNVNKPGKVRPVFDLAERHEGVSLNDCLLTGPNSTASLIGVLMRARKGQVCVMSDIKAMFSQCYVAPEDRDSQRFLWFDQHGKTQEFRMNTHVFGAADSPFVANRILKQIGIDHGSRYDPSVVEALDSSFYVDDSMLSTDTTEDAVRISRELKSLLRKGGFQLCKFVSNDKEVLKSFPQSERANPDVDLQFDKLPTERALGLKWDLETDSFCFQISHLEKPDTMRGMVGTIASLFDPLGFAAPIIIAARLLVQECWKLELDWDDPLPQSVLGPWLKWKTQLPRLEEVRVPRPYFRGINGSFSPDVQLQLHLFSDSSSFATGCAAYLRAVSPDGNIHVGFVFGKARVLPKRPKLTIPRAELKAAVEAVRIGEMLKAELKLELDSDCYFYWTDSEICLKYLANRTKRFHVFVANRQSEIRLHTELNQWRFCPGTLNVGDDPSRGIMPDRFTSEHRYLVGPEFLRLPTTEWPSRIIGADLADDDPEVKCCRTEIVADGEPESEIASLLSRKSSWLTVRKVIARILRWSDSKRHRRRIDASSTVTSAELARAEIAIVRMVQREHYGDEIVALEAAERVDRSSSILSLNPTLEEGLLVVGGRLRNAPDVPYIVKNPIILPSPKVCRLSQLIIEDVHRKLAHAGQELVMGVVRERYWIVNVRTSIRKLIHRCFHCRKRNAQPITQIMGNLPRDRFSLFQPCFTNTGTDLFGPIICRQRRSYIKHYGVIFLCLTSMAVHIETVASLSTDDFIRSLQRFVAIRGGVKRIRSDNGGNYVGAERELREIVSAWNSEKINATMSVRGVEWSFQPPYASSQSGVWERRVRETKRHLTAILPNREPDPDVLRTALYEVSAILNSAPLCPVSSDPGSFEALTPAHFLFNKEVEVMCPVPTDPKTPYRNKWRQVQQLADVFWRRFSKEYVPTLLPRRKWKTQRRNLREGDLVLLMMEDLQPRGRWKMGRVVEVFTGTDGNVRSARVKTADGLYVRPIQRLGLIAENESDELVRPNIDPVMPDAEPST